MTDFVTYQGKVAGAALLLSLLSVAIGLILVAAQGRLHGLAAAFRGVEGIGEAASALSVMAWAGLPFILFQLIGFGVLAVMLEEAGETTLARLSFAFLLVALIVSSIEGTFQGSVTAWAGRQWAATGQVPELYEALRAWVNGVVQPVYVVAYLLGMAGFGWAVLRAGLMAPWAGWVSLGWSLLWLVFYWVVGIPAIIVVFPLIYGVGLWVYG